MKTLILTLILTAQATANSFDTFISEFNSETGAAYTGNVKFGNTKPSESAVANLSSATPYNSEIVVNMERWKDYSHSERRWLIYHELAHAAFGAPHNNALLDDGCPTTPLYFETIKSACIRKHENIYLDYLKKLKLKKGSMFDIYVNYLKVK